MIELLGCNERGEEVTIGNTGGEPISLSGCVFHDEDRNHETGLGFGPGPARPREEGASSGCDSLGWSRLAHGRMLEHPGVCVMGTVTFRVRSVVWFVTGAVLAAAVTVMFMNAWRVDAAPGDDDATFVPITPCRLADTRPAPIRVGTAGTLSAADTTTFAVHGTNGECTIPTDAVAVSMNVTALGATVQSFLTFWPDGDQPLAASLNPAPGEPPTPNAVTTDLSGSGAFNVYNDTGTVNVVIDINGYYIQSSLQELASRLAAVEAAQAAGVDPAVLARLEAAEADIGAVETGVATNASDIGAVETGVASNASDIGAVETGVATNASGVATNASGIATNASGIATNASGIATNASGVDALDAAQPFAIQDFQDFNLDLTATVTGYLTVTVTAPLDGQVALSASAMVSHGEVGGNVRCTIAESTDIPASLAALPTGVGTLFESDGTDADFGSVSAVRVFDIAAGATVDYVLACDESPDGGVIFGRLMTATFTPAP